MFTKFKQRIHLVIAFVAIVALLVTMTLVPLLSTSAAPLGAVTPVTFANNASRAQGLPRIVNFSLGTPAAYLTPVTNCYDMSGYNTLDIVYKSASVAAVTIDQVYGNDTTVLAAGASILNSATPVVTPAAVEIPIFNAYNCVKITSADATPIAVYVKGLAK